MRKFNTEILKNKKTNVIVCNLFKDFLEEEKQLYKFQTYEERITIINNYVLPHFYEGRNLKQCLSIDKVEKFKLTTYSLDLSVGRKNLIYSTFKSFLSFVQARDYVDYNYIEKIKRLIRSIRKNKYRPQKLTFWTPEEFDCFINSFNYVDSKWKLFFLTTYWAGLRMGEVIPLKWDDFDFRTKLVSINKSMDRDGNISTTKNESSNDSVDLPTFLSEELKQFKIDSEPHSNEDYVFFDNHHLARTTIRRMMDKHALMCGNKHIKFHGLRHSIASRMINQGLNPLIVSTHLRHSSTQQTLDTYSHLFPKITKNVMDQIV